MARARDRWRELCEFAAKDDGLPTWEQAGAWTRDKLYFWKRYVDITTKAMSKQNTAFPSGIAYVDLFGGAGVCTLRGTGERFPGSALIAASAACPFSKIIVCEKQPELAQACESRLMRNEVAERCEVLCGDCNELIGEIVSRIPPRALTLAFVDPKGLDAQFSSVERLTRRRKVDLVLLFADTYDICRNDLTYYWENPDSKLDKVLGPESNWRNVLSEAGFPTGLTRRRLFADIYTEQLRRRLGYKAFGEKPMRCEGKPLYRLIYASKDTLGKKFWDEAVKEDSSGQRDLF